MKVHNITYETCLSRFLSPTMTSTIPHRTIEHLSKKYPDIMALDEHDPYYRLWKSAWHKANTLFDSEDGYPVLRIEDPDRGLSHIIVRAEYVQAYEDARSVYTDAITTGEERFFEVPDDPSSFTLAGKQSLNIGGHDS